MKDIPFGSKRSFDRRAFMKSGLAAGAATVGAGLLARTESALAIPGPQAHRGRLTRGDAALLRFAAAAEILETDFWVQYNDLGGFQDSECLRRQTEENSDLEISLIRRSQGLRRPQASAMFDHSSHWNKRDCNAGGEFSDGHGTLHRLTAGVL